MVDKRGYVLLWRKIVECDALKEKGKVFSKFEAWVHIVLILASGIDKGEVLRGEFQASYRFMAGAWNWNISKVHRFIGDLIDEKMLEKVERQTERKMEHLKVCNYDTYNPTRNAEWNAKRNKLNKGLKEGLNNTTTEGEQPVICIPVKDGPEIPIYQSLVSEYETAYSNINVKEILKKIRAWAISNPKKQWTTKGALRGVNSWLAGDEEKCKSQNLLKDLTGKMGF